MIIYDRALSAAEIKDIFNAGPAGKCQPPLLLDDGIPPSWRERFFGAQYRVDPRMTAVADPDQDGANNYQEYLADTHPLDRNSVHRVPRHVSTFAGSVQGRQDGPLASATFTYPAGLAQDRQGRLYVAEAYFPAFDVAGYGGQSIRLIDTNGMVSTWTGGADWENYQVRKITPDGTVTTFAGSGLGAQDGPRSSATFNGPAYVSWRNDGSLFVADWGNGLVRKISPAGIVSTFASGLPYVEGVEVDAQGSVYAAVSSLNTLDKYSAEGREIWRFTPQKGTEDGPVPFAKIGHFNTPFIFANGDILLTEDSAHRLRLVKVGPPPLLEIAPSGRVFTNSIVVDMTTPVSNGVIKFMLNEDAPISESLTYTKALTLTNTTAVLAQVFVSGIPVSEVATERFTAATFAAVSGSVAVSTLAGSANAGFRDARGVAAQFHFPNGGFVGPDGLVYVADTSNHRIRRVNPTDGEVSTIAGTGQAGYGDGSGTNAQFNLPLGLFVNAAGEIFVADTGNNRIRKIAREGSVTTVVGTGTAGFIDGDERIAAFNGPGGIG